MPNHSKQRKFLIATHGIMASGIKSSLDLIIGAMDNIFLLEAYVDENISVEDELQKILKQVDEDEELVVFTDILGGSVTNQILRDALRPNVYIVSGVNLPLVIDVLLADTEAPMDTIIEEAILNAQNQMVFVNKMITAEYKDHQND